MRRARERRAEATGTPVEQVRYAAGAVVAGPAAGPGPRLDRPGQRAGAVRAARYDHDGQPQVRSLLDHLLPTVAEIPEVRLQETQTPNPHSPFGAKGAGEAGCIGVPPALLDAVADALDLDDPSQVQLPTTPDHVRALLHPPHP